MRSQIISKLIEELESEGAGLKNLILILIKNEDCRKFLEENKINIDKLLEILSRAVEEDEIMNVFFNKILTLIGGESEEEHDIIRELKVIDRVLGEKCDEIDVLCWFFLFYGEGRRNFLAQTLSGTLVAQAIGSVYHPFILDRGVINEMFNVKYRELEKIFRERLFNKYPELTKEKISRARERVNNNIDMLINLNDSIVEHSIVGRDEEINKMVRILCKKEKNNVLIVGDPGVGKTALVEGLVKKIEKEEVPSQLLNKVVHYLNVNDLVAGTIYRGQFEQRVKKVIDSLTENDILFIDEIHTAIKSGSGENSPLDLANALKKPISEGKIKVIGATTYDDYRKFLENDRAFLRRFQIIKLDEPSDEIVKQILLDRRSIFEKYHKITIPLELIDLVIKLSKRYITSKKFPDKAIDVLDESCALANLKNEKVLSDDHIKKIVSEHSGIPVENLTSDEIKFYKNLDRKLKEKIVGQDNAIDVIYKAILASKLNLKDSQKPIGSFLFVGSTGSGKTYTAKVLSEVLNMPLLRIDMSEFAQDFSTTKLIGAPAGYVGYQEGGKIIEFLKKNPYCIMLFDEIEKAHPSVLNVLLQIMDEGIITSNKGETFDLKNSIIILTSNVGSHRYTEGRIGFISNPEDINQSVLQEVKSSLKPELFNRLDAVIVFNMLTRKDMEKIVRLEMDKRFAESDVVVKYDDKVVDFLVEKGFSPEYGARPLKRAINDYIIPVVSDQVIKGKNKINLSVRRNKIVVINKKPKEVKNAC